MAANSDGTATATATNDVLDNILKELQALRLRNDLLEAKLDNLTASPSGYNGTNTRRYSSSTGLTPVPSPSIPTAALAASPPPLSHGAMGAGPGANLSPTLAPRDQHGLPTAVNVLGASLYPQRVILTTHPGQPGIKPLPMEWAARDVKVRGPVVASRHPSSIKVRNALGAYGGSYSIYRALATAMGQLDPNHRPNFTNTEPYYDIPPNPSWFDPTKIVALDPWGHLAPQLFKDEFDAGIDVRPTIAVTRAQLKMAELDASVAAGNLEADGKIVVPSGHLPGADPNSDPGVEINTSKAAVDPVWYLPGVAARLGVSEGLLRRALFEDTGGSYPELLTRHDIKVFLPPINGLTVYIFGPPEYLRDETKEVTVRVHDECNGSDTFGSSICTCKPYLVFGIEEAIKCAQRGGVGCVIYFRKEGRALGEVTKYLVYNARKRGVDSASTYFKRTEDIAGVKDMRFQALMPDVLHWLGIKRIDNMISMSDMKHDALVQSGIPIIKRYEIPDELMPSDSRVEIDAKIAAGYFSGTKKLTEADLVHTVGKSWDDIEH